MIETKQTRYCDICGERMVHETFSFTAECKDHRTGEVEKLPNLILCQEICLAEHIPTPRKMDVCPRCSAALAYTIEAIKYKLQSEAADVNTGGQ